MTSLMEEVIKKAATLPDDVQDTLARELLQQIEWELRWDQTLENSQDALNKLTEKAIAEFKAGKTREAGFDEL